MSLHYAREGGSGGREAIHSFTRLVTFTFSYLPPCLQLNLHLHSKLHQELIFHHPTLHLQPENSHITPSHHPALNSVPKRAVQRNGMWTVRGIMPVYSHQQAAALQVKNRMQRRETREDKKKSCSAQWDPMCAKLLITREYPPRRRPGTVLAWGGGVGISG